MLVPLFGDDGEDCVGWRFALSSQDTSSSRTWCSSAISPSSFGPSLVILGRFPPRLGPWAYYSKWAGAPRSLGPPIFNWKYFKENGLLSSVVCIFGNTIEKYSSIWLIQKSQVFLFFFFWILNKNLILQFEIFLHKKKKKKKKRSQINLKQIYSK